MDLDPHFLKLVLREIKAESVNVEYAIEKISSNLEFRKDHEKILELLKKLLAK